MPYTPNPIVFGQTPASGVLLTVTEQRGGLAGYILTGVSGPAATITLNGNPLDYPTTLNSGDALRLHRESGAELTIIAALAPIGDAEPPVSAGLVITAEPDGTLSSDDPRITAEPDGTLTAPDTLVAVDNDGTLTEVTP